MRSKLIESDPRFVPHDRPPRAGGWTRLVVPLLVLGGYVALAGAQDGPIQVWLVVFAPLVLIAFALVLGVTHDAESERAQRAHRRQSRSSLSPSE